MIGGRLGIPQAIGLSLLVQSVLVLGPGSAFPEPKPQPARSAQKRIAQSNPGAGPATEQPGRCVHVVRRGDSLGRLATLYRTTRRSIIAANASLDLAKLRAGQRLKIAQCRTAPVQGDEEPQATTVVNGTTTELLARVGPRRIPTRLFVAVPNVDPDLTPFQWPIDGYVASGFGRRHKGWHAGIDIQADLGTPIKASAGGTVILSGWERFYGHFIKIQHPDGFTSLYAHNLENLVQAGDEVESGAVIGTVGRSGHASGSHLHFEIRQEGVAYNPLHLLERRDSPPLLADTATAMFADQEDRE